MSQTFAAISNDITAAVDRASRSVVQISAHRRPVAGVVFANNLVLVPARALGDDTAVVRLPDGETVEGQVLGDAASTGLGVVRVERGDLTPATTAAEPQVGALAIAIGRTWSGAVMATVTNVAVVGGPLRTGRGREIERVVRVAQPPHGALTGGALIDGTGALLGIITGADIRGTTVVIPATLAWAAGHQTVERGGTRQGYLGISTTSVSIPTRQRDGHSTDRGILVTAVAESSPAEKAGLLVGDIILTFAGTPVIDPESLITLLRGNHVDKAVTLSVLRGVKRQDIAVTVGERPRHRG